MTTQHLTPTLRECKEHLHSALNRRGKGNCPDIVVLDSRIVCEVLHRLQAMEMELELAEDTIKSLLADASRYRLLRKGQEPLYISDLRRISNLEGSDADETIDAELQRLASEGEAP